MVLIMYRIMLIVSALSAQVGPLTITSLTLPQATVGQPYSFTFSVAGGVAPYRFMLATGSLPTGLVLSATGALTGTPTLIGTSAFVVRVDDAAGANAAHGFTLTVNTGGTGDTGFQLTVSPKAMSFSYRRDGPLPAKQTIALGPVEVPANFFATVTTTRGGNWLAVSPTSGARLTDISVNVNPAGLSSGTYTGSVTLTAITTGTDIAATRIAQNVVMITLTVTDPTPTAPERTEIISTVVGNDWVFPATGDQATAAPLGHIFAVTLDAQSNLLLGDADNNLVVRVLSDGSYQVVAGNGLTGFSGDGGPATGASLNNPSGIAADSAGNIYFSELGNARVRRVTPDGVISTFAGTGHTGNTGDGGPATSATLSEPVALAVDGSGNLYIADRASGVIRRVGTDGIISTYAGNGKPGYSGDGGPATEASIFPDTDTMAIDAGGNLYFSEFGNNRVRRVSPDGIITTVAGTGVASYNGDNRPASDAWLRNPAGVAVDADGSLYIADTNNFRLRKVSPDGTITTIAGNGNVTSSGDGGPATSASVLGVFGVVADASGNVYLADSQRVRIIDPTGTINTFAGNDAYRNVPDGTSAAFAYFREPAGMTFDAAGNLLVSDFSAQRIRKIDTAGTYSTVAGNGNAGRSSGPIAAIRSFLNGPQAIVTDAAGNIYFSDRSNHWVKKIDATGTMTIFAGSTQGFDGDNGKASNAKLNFPAGLAFDGSGNLFIADCRNGRVRKVDGDSNVSTVAGNGSTGNGGDGGPALQAPLNCPFALAFDGAGNLYIAEYNSSRVRRMTPDGTLATVTGNGQSISTGDGGPASSATLNHPSALTFDAAGNLYIAEYDANRVRIIDRAGRISTIAGVGGAGFTGDGDLATRARLRNPEALAVDKAGRLYIADAGNSRIRVVSPPGLGAGFGDGGSSQITVAASPAALRFQLRSDGGVSSPQTIDVSSSAQGAAFSVSTSTSTQGSVNWLRVSPSDGQSPATLSVSVDPAGLTPGTYTGTITISTPAAIPPRLAINVALTLIAPDPPKLSYEPQEISLALPEVDGAEDRVLFVSNIGSGALAFSAETSGESWLSIATLTPIAMPGASGSVRVSVRTAGLAPGDYRARVLLTSATTGEKVAAPVSLTVTPVARPRILLSQTGLTFQSYPGGSGFPQCFAVLNAGSGTLDFTVSTNVSWLAARRGACPLRAVSGVFSPPEVIVEVNPAGLPPNANGYDGEVQVAAPGADNTPQTVKVKLVIVQGENRIGPRLSLSGLVFTGVAGGAPSSSLLVTIFNFTTSAFQVFSGAIYDSSPFFSFTPQRGNVPPAGNGDPLTIQVQPTPQGLSTGFYTGYITVGTNNYGARTIQVLMALSASATPSAAGERGASGCSPSALSMVYTLLPDGFETGIGQPQPLEVAVSDNCGAPMTRGSVVATFSSSDRPLALIALGDGRWTGTWTPTTLPGDGLVTITVKAQLPDGAQPVSLTRSGRLTR
jgi:sugar lactone lactonase YvrE